MSICGILALGQISTFSAWYLLRFQYSWKVVFYHFNLSMTFVSFYFQNQSWWVKWWLGLFWPFTAFPSHCHRQGMHNFCVGISVEYRPKQNIRNSAWAEFWLYTYLLLNPCTITEYIVTPRARRKLLIALAGGKIVKPGRVFYHLKKAISCWIGAPMKAWDGIKGEEFEKMYDF